MKRRQPYPFLKKDITRHGQLRFYLRRVIDGVETKTRLPDHPGATKEAEAAYYAALAGTPVERTPIERRYGENTFGALVSRYLGSPKFGGLSPITQQHRRRHLEALRKEFGDVSRYEFRKKHIKAILERMAGSPGSANNRLKALQGLFGYAIEFDLLETSPAAGIKKFPVNTERGGGSRTWRQEHADMFRSRWPLGTPQRTLFEIMWNTALRIGDALKLGPQHIRDGRVRMITSKKGEGIDLPLLPELAEALAAFPARHLTYLATQAGRPRSAKAGYQWFSTAAKEAGLPPKYTAHGCRKALLTARAEAGANEQQLAAIAGHGSTRSVQAYVKEARRRILADAGLGIAPEEGPERPKEEHLIGSPSKKVSQNRP